MKIGIAQINTRAGDFAATASRMEGISRVAREQGVELLLFPLVALTGPQPVEYASQEGNLLDLSDTLVRLSDGLECPCVVPVVTDMDGAAYPEAMLVRGGEVTPLRLHAYVSGNDAGRPSERRDSSSVSTFEYGGLRMGLCFTYEDLDAFEHAEEQVDVLLFFSGYGYALDDTGSVMGAALGENRYRTDANVLDAWLVGIASLGGYGTQVYTGSSFVLAPQGELVVSSPAFEEELLVAKVATSDAFGFAPFEPEIYNRSLHLWESLSLGLHDYLSKLGLSDVALVLDGSLASVLLAVLSSDALGPQHVHVLVDSTRRDQEMDAVRAMAMALHVDVVDVQPLACGEVADERMRVDLSRAQLAAYARSSGAMPLSSEDKTFLAVEISPGSCYVDGLLPFGDVYRTDLIELAHMRNTISPVIPAQAIKAFEVPDIAGLTDAEATPEMQLQRVDVTLATHVEWERGLSDVVARQGSEELTANILRRLRSCEPVRASRRSVLVVSSRTLYDARMPLGYAWHDRVRSVDERLAGNEVMDRLASLMGDASDASTAVESLLGGIDIESGAIAGIPLPEGVDRKSMESTVGDLLGLLQDLLQSGGLSIERPEGGNPPLDGPLGPLTWGSPFSEN